MPRKIIPLGLILLAGCTSQPVGHGLMYDLTDCLTERVSVSVVTYDSSKDVAAAYNALAGTKRQRQQGFASRQGGKYTLHIKRITSVYDKDIEVLGHELIHALCGNGWHEKTRLEK